MSLDVRPQSTRFGDDDVTRGQVSETTGFGDDDVTRGQVSETTGPGEDVGHQRSGLGPQGLVIVSLEARPETTGFGDGVTRGQA